MRLEIPISVEILAEELNATLVGDSDQWIHGINEIHKVQPGDLTFVDAEKYYQKSLESRASVIIIDKKTVCPPGKTLLIVENPFFSYNKLVEKYCPFNPLLKSRGESIQIDSSTIIEHNVTIGHQVTIGADCYIQGNCYIGNNTTIGDRVIIQAGTIIGTDAFYFKEENSIHTKWHSGGNVIIENDVFIGAGCTINKGVSGSTVIGKGTKIDSQVHIGHGVELGENCLLAGQVGIGGKAKIGNRVKIYGQAGVANNITVGDDAIILAKTGVLRSLPDGKKSYFGMPAEEARKKFMQIVAVKNLVK